ncbi:ras and EF-hand domain-containing protein-like isoform X2 [Uloborus diversus]|uniref:ras and EF-hand domain-containing protein-like isoform X2 n=2 Tax=Uloborus diversus TaxID=327109 RepID=UPI002409FAEC|nr:ras and EF-hand domain-containing protein-like isoform X2 [Uloborus diversus]
MFKSDAMSVQLQNFFKYCDPDGTKSVDREAFRDLCNRLNITNQDADLIFEDLDLDNDGRISFEDFSRGFSNFLSTADMCDTEFTSYQTEMEQPEEATKHHVWSTLTNEAERTGQKHSDEGKLKWLLNELQTSEQKHLVPYLESAVEELLGNLQHLQEEKSRLENSWKREKVEHEKHLKRMEEELDNQVKEAEMKLRLKAQEEVEDERKTLQTKMDGELDKVQSHLALIEKVYSWLRTQPLEQRDCRLDEVKAKLDDAVHENRQLRMSLLDTQTSIALMRSELLQLRTMYEEKCRELSSEREKIMEVLQEQDHLSRQLSLLHDANRRLLDNADSIRSSVETSSKQNSIIGTPRAKSGSIIGDYLDIGHSREYLSRFSEDDEDIDIDDEESIKLKKAVSMDVLVQRRRKSKNKGSKSARLSLNQSDSGVSTVRDSCEPDEVWDMSPRDDRDSDDERLVSRSNRRGSRPVSMPPPENSSEDRSHLSVMDSRYYKMRSSTSQDSILDTESFPRRKISDIKKQLGIEDKPVSWSKSWSPNPNKCSTPKGISQTEGLSPPVPLPRTSKILQSKEESKEDDENSLAITSVEDDESEYEPNGPAEQTFKVIFVGDAGVGKSSFALRISKGVFVRHMSSTLGVDFLMRTIRVDGRNVAVQLWDTAGQERFRSITKSYFRKADGVMLLYDCTCEHSFLNVRNWVEDIDKAAMQRIPLMIVANKTDLRAVAIKSGATCITTEQGEKLAKDCDTTFMEASAKDGSNVLRALSNLIRSMSTYQDLQMSASTMQLCDLKDKKSKGCCGK